MNRFFHAALCLGLAIAVQGATFFVPQVSMASDDEGSGEKEIPAENPDFLSGDVAGIIYKIEGDSGLKVVTIYDTDVGLGVKGYVRDLALLAAISRNDICVGRYVVAHGIRTSDTTLEVQGFDIDRTTACGTPPK